MILLVILKDGPVRFHRRADVKKKLLLILQTVLCIVTAIVLSVSALVIYVNGAALKASDPLSPIYTREKVIRALIPAVILIGIGLILMIVSFAKGIRDENAMRPAKSVKISRKLTSKKTDKAVNIFRVVILLLAVIFIILGVNNGSANDVFGKAVNICTECIGLG